MKALWEHLGLEEQHLANTYAMLVLVLPAWLQVTEERDIFQHGLRFALVPQLFPRFPIKHSIVKRSGVVTQSVFMWETSLSNSQMW